MASAPRPSGREPNWARVPPHVPTYPNPPAFFRKTPAEKYTAPIGKQHYFQQSDHWHVIQPEWKEEHYRLDSRTPVMRCKEFQTGVTKPQYLASRDKPDWRAEYYRQGGPVSETVRARGLNRIHWARRDKNLYQFSNNMTSTQYQKPVSSIYGPMLKEKVYGVNDQHNYHGFMPFNDYYF